MTLGTTQSVRFVLSAYRFVRLIFIFSKPCVLVVYNLNFDFLNVADCLYLDVPSPQRIDTNGVGLVTVPILSYGILKLIKSHCQ